jgi:signal transduction histidine kinase
MENALKYTPAGGQVTVSLREEEGGVTLAVADTGVGIPEVDREKIFDRFYRVDKARSRAAGGTGLGLSIAKDMVLLHGGTISAAPNHPTGSVFTVTFPRREEDAL